ncbi:polymorphic toxin-type HINT domain-containing protein, partial [Streptomyces albipurpureus]
ADAQQMHGYTYGNNNPVVISDPTGLYGAWCANITCVNQTGGPGTAPTSYPKPTHTKGSGGGGSGKNSGGGSGGGGGGHSGNGGGSGGGGHSGGKKKSSKPDRNWGESIYYGVGEVFYGAISTVPYAAEMGGWLVDSDCWNEGGPGSPGCDYGSQYDNYMESQGYDTSSAAYQIPGLLGALFGRKPAKPAKPKPTRCPNSFLAGTDVLMADGTTKNIEDIEVGNTVIATNPETGESGPRKVTQLITTKSDKADKGLNRLTIATDDGIQPLTATNEHPFWSPSGSRWLDAADLAKGMTLLTDDGDTVTVTANRPFTRHTKTYNLTVDDLHTYYVLAGQTPVLVHNSGPCGISTRNEKAGDIGNYTDGQKTRDPASQWYHEELSNDELLDGINNPGDGDGILVSRDGKILGGHHRKDELQRRIQDGRIDPDTEIRIDVYDPE